MTGEFGNADQSHPWSDLSVVVGRAYLADRFSQDLIDDPRSGPGRCPGDGAVAAAFYIG